MLKDFFYIKWLTSGDGCHLDHLYDLVCEVGVDTFALLIGLKESKRYNTYLLALRERDNYLLSLVIYTHLPDNSILVKDNETWKLTTTERL